MRCKNKFTRFLSSLLCMSMVFSTFSVAAYAETDNHNNEIVTYSDTTTRWTPTGSDSNVKYLSDMETIDSLESGDAKTNTTYVEAGHYIRNDKNDQSKTITLLIDGEPQYFIKGVSAWATSNVIYDIGGLGYTNFHTYVGVDYEQKDNVSYNSGVKFTIYTSKDGKEWTAKHSTGVLVAYGNAEEINIDLTEEDRYLRLYADMNGTGWWHMWYDDAVYADAKLTKDGYVDNKTTSDLILPITEYDTIIKKQDINDINAYELTLLKREFVDRIGYDILQSLIRYDKSYAEVIEWLFSDVNIIKEFLLGGTPDGSYVATLKILNELYHTYQSDINTPLYRRMMITLALTHSQAVGTWVTGAPENPDDPNGSNALVRYAIYKKLYEEDKLDPLFKRSSVEEMRFVMNNIISDEEINWLYWCTQQQKAGHFVGRTGDFMNPYTYVEYQGYDYSLPQYYDQEHYDEWNTKYHLAEFGIHYGYTKSWIVFEQGGVCGAIAKTGSNIRGVYGIPSTVVSQPGHAAYIYQSLDSKGNVIWELYNDVYGWAQSGKTEKLITRMPLGWGTGNYTSGYEAAYILLAQAAIDDKDGSLEKAEELVALAKVYENDADKARQIYKKALSEQKINLDAWLGLINSYIKDGATQEDYLQSAQDIVDALTYYPRPMYDLLMLIRNQLEFKNQVVLDAMLDVALDKAIVATSNDVLQPNPTRDVAKYLKGNNTVEVATFSFDGEYAGQIRLADRYASGGVTWQYTVTGIDSSKSWKDNGNWSQSISDPYYQLSEEEIASITEENNILIRIVGAMDTVYSIDITKGVIPTTVYANDLENHIFGLSTTMEWRIKESDNIKEISEEWTRFSEIEPNLKGTKTVEIRSGSTGTQLASEPIEFSFTPNGEDPTNYYIPVSRLSIKDYSTDQKNQNNSVQNLLDGNINTIWHTAWDGSDKEQYVIYELERPAYISSIEYVPRQTGTNGIAKGFEIYFSMDGEEWENVVWYADVSVDRTIDLKYWSDMYTEWYEEYKDMGYPEWDISHLKTKYIKLVNSATTRSQYLSAAMFNFFEDTTLNSSFPMIEIVYSPNIATNQPVTATLQMDPNDPKNKDKNIEDVLILTDKDAECLKDKDDSDCLTDFTHIFEENDEYTFYYALKSDFEAYKNGDISFDEILTGQITAKVNWIQTTEIPVHIEFNTQNPTNQNVEATLVCDDEDRNLIITNNGGKDTYVFESNSDEGFTFTYQDRYGNTGSISTGSITWIDKEAPTGHIEYNPDKDLGNAYDTVTATLVIDSKEEQVIVVSEGGYTHEFDKNGEFEFIFTDELGNMNHLMAIVDWIVSSEISFEINYDDSQFVIDKDDLTDKILDSIMNDEPLSEILKAEDAKIIVTIEDNAASDVFDNVDGEIAKCFNISIMVKNNEGEYPLTELSEAITLKVKIPTDLPNVEDNATREYYVLREHNNKVEKLEVKEDGEYLTFESDKFSTYALVYKDSKPDVEEHIHEWEDDFTIDVPATCEKEGLKSIHCKGCSETTNETVIPATGHVISTHNHENEIPATCTSSGSYDCITRCRVCGVQLAINHTTTPALDHTWSDWEIITEGSCNTDGYKQRYCTTCGYVESVLTSDAEHVWSDEETIDKEPTCTTDGSKSIHCVNCGAILKSEVIPATGHIEGQVVIENVVPSDCVNDGSHTETIICEVCHTTIRKTEVVDKASGHNFGDWTTIVMPDCDDEGTEQRECSVCGAVETRGLVAEGHTWDNEFTIDVEATCITAGSKSIHCLKCNARTETVIIPAKGHTLGEVQIENEITASCVTSGSHTETIYCTECGAVIDRKNVVTDPIGHDWTDWEIIDTPNCEDSGTKQRTCKVCGVTETEGLQVDGHDWIEGFIIDQEPTCTDEGSMSIHCKNCDAKMNSTTIPPKGHTPNEPVRENEISATCTSGGYVELVTYCRDCNTIIFKDVQISDPLGHTYGEWEETKAPTCTEAGEKKRQCTVCGNEETELIDKLQHDWNDDFTIDLEPNCTTAGVKSIHCKNCYMRDNITKIEAVGHIEAKPIHEQEVPASCTTNGSYDEVIYCSVCYELISKKHIEVDAIGHQFSEWITIEMPDCDDDGTRQRTCSVCGYTEVDGLVAEGHTWETSKSIDVEPTCTTDGSKSIHCTKCDAKTDIEVIPMLGHIEGEHYKENETTPNCTTDGFYYDVTICDRCGLVMSREQVVVPSIGHSFDDWIIIEAPKCEDDGLKQRICKVCGYIEMENVDETKHDWMSDFTIDKEPTCTDEGSQSIHCKNCDAVKEQQTIAPIDHVAGEPQTTIEEATCIENGYIKTYVYCDICGTLLSFDVTMTDTIDHTSGEEVKEVVKEATCTESGSYNLIVYCSVCREVLETASHEMEALGHKFGEWKTINNSTCTKNGSKERVCERCGYVETEGLDLAEHKSGEYEISKEATCTSDGSEVLKCSVCGIVLESKVIPAKGHTTETKNKKDATCKEEGYTGDVICTVCGQTISKGKTISKTSHNFKDGVCTVCGAKDSSYKEDSTSKENSTNKETSTSIESSSSTTNSSNTTTSSSTTNSSNTTTSNSTVTSSNSSNTNDGVKDSSSVSTGDNYQSIMIFVAIAIILSIVAFVLLRRKKK